MLYNRLVIPHRLRQPAMPGAPFSFSHSIVVDLCEGVGDCILACPEACIRMVVDSVNAKGTVYAVVDAARCRNCGVCFQICPIEGAVVPCSAEVGPDRLPGTIQ